MQGNRSIQIGYQYLLIMEKNMRIDEDIKLDYKDVLIRPKRSTLKSRQQVNLERRFTFRHSQTRL